MSSFVLWKLTLKNVNTSYVFEFVFQHFFVFASSKLALLSLDGSGVGGSPPSPPSPPEPLLVSSVTEFGPKQQEGGKWLALRGALNLILVGILFVPVLYFYIDGTPVVRGFFCNDKALMHPYHK